MKGTWRRPEATHSQIYLQAPPRVASEKEYVPSLSSANEIAGIFDPFLFFLFMTIF
jgi:hypothetical protein